MRKFFEPASAPLWLKPVLSSIRAALGDIWDVPVRPAQFVTSDLPPAADHKGGLVYDLTLDLAKYSDGSVFLTLVDTSGAVFTGIVDVGGEYRVDGTKVVGNQGAAVADATGAGDVVAQLNALLARLRTHGLIAT
jgi:hypothetical protein